MYDKLCVWIKFVRIKVIELVDVEIIVGWLFVKVIISKVIVEVNIVESGWILVIIVNLIIFGKMVIEEMRFVNRLFCLLFNYLFFLILNNIEKFF